MPACNLWICFPEMISWKGDLISQWMWEGRFSVGVGFIFSCFEERNGFKNIHRKDGNARHCRKP